MTWLRIDDGFAQHPKIVQLTPKDRWIWMEILCYCARYRTEGWLSDAIAEAIRGATPPFLKRCRELGLLDTDKRGDIVHDWADFNPKDPTKADRQARWRAKQASDVDASVDDPVDGDVDEPVDATVDAPVDSATVHSRAGTRARTRPVPTTKTLRSSGDQRSLGSPPTTPQQAASPANGTRPAVDIALDFVRNVGAELPTADLDANIRAALTDAQGHHCRADELDDDDWITLRDLHADLATQEEAT